MKYVNIGASTARLLLISERQLNAILLIKEDGYKQEMVEAIKMVASGHTISRAARLKRVDRAGLSRNIKNIRKWDKIIRGGYININT